MRVGPLITLLVTDNNIGTGCNFMMHIYNEYFCALHNNSSFVHAASVVQLLFIIK